MLDEAKGMFPATRDGSCEQAVPCTPRVLVVAPGMTSRGGIVSVVRLHMSMPLWKEMRCDLLETYDDGGSWAKVRAACRAYLLAPGKVLRADLVHLHLAGELSLLRKLPIVALARFFRKPLLVHVHASSPESLFSATPAWAVRFVLSNADRVIALSRSWASLIGAQVPGTKTCIVPNPVQTFTPTRAAGARKPVVLFVGRLEARKGYKTLLQAAAIVLRRFPDTQFWFAGHGELEAAAAEAERLGIRSSVCLMGWTNSEKTASLYEQASVFCLPSHNEGVPMSVLEAMSHGVPVVCTRVGGLPEFVCCGRGHGNVR